MKNACLLLLSAGMLSGSAFAQAQAPRMVSCQLPDSLYAQLWLADSVVQAGAAPQVFFALTNQGAAPRRVLLGKDNQMGGAWGLRIAVTDQRGRNMEQYPTRAVLVSQAYTAQQLEKLKVPLPAQARGTVTFSLYALLVVDPAHRTADGKLPPGTYRLRFSYQPVVGQQNKICRFRPLTLVVQ